MTKGLVYGVGINDADYIVKPSELINGKYVITGECPVYSTWKDLVRRCYNESFKASHPCYINTTMSEDWLRFSIFKSWVDKVTEKDYYDIDGKKLRLDKDLLIPNNKHYSPDTCVMVSVKVNNFILSGLNRNSQGKNLPRGVILNKVRGIYQVFCKDPFNRNSKFIGESSDLGYCERLYTTTKLNYLKDLYKRNYLNLDLYEKIKFNMVNGFYP
ncbi:HNH endonuclease [Vibrio phage 11895-B1]|uniref:HNH endonuclease n=1 Tax=Vibrio phage 11895-B1 TaxID=754075 RepID=UPI0002C04340|nr:HNH endonuclease [Vibrio phage 11895-B1]AGH32233.1 hypothetical protein VPHG_00170 [Vibrio phage 11895-B1]